jgi:hypothetical protein
MNIVLNFKSTDGNTALENNNTTSRISTTAGRAIRKRTSKMFHAKIGTDKVANPI